MKYERYPAFPAPENVGHSVVAVQFIYATRAELIEFISISFLIM